MFTFGNGLVLREGERTFQFERELSCFELQFRYLDNNEVRTFSRLKLYKQILEKTVIPVHQNGYPIAQPNRVSVQEREYTYSTTLSDRQERTIQFRQFLVKRATAQGVTPGSQERCEAFLADVRRKGEAYFAKCFPQGETSELLKLPCADTLRKWMKRSQSSGNNPYALLDLRPLVRRRKRIDPDVEASVERSIAKYYLQKHGLSVAETFRRYLQDTAQEERLLGAKTEVASLRSMQRACPNFCV